MWGPPRAGGPCAPQRGWRPERRLSPRSPGYTHRLQEAQGAHVVPLGAQDLVEDAEAEAQLALRLPGGRALAGDGRSGAGCPGVQVGTVPSPVAAGIAAAGHLHPSAAARHRLLPPRGGRAERRLRRPGTPSRTGRAGGPGSAAGPAHGAAGEQAGLGAGGPARGRRQRAEAGRGAGGGRPSGLPDGWPGRRLPPPPRERLPSATPRSGRRGAPRAHWALWRCAAALGCYVGSSARPELGAGGSWARIFREGPRGAPRVRSSAPATANAPTPLPDAWRPPVRRGLRHSHPDTRDTHRAQHKHAGPAAGCRRSG